MKNYLVEVVHDQTPNKVYTFRATSRLKVGELTVCRTRFGYTYGIVTGTKKTSYKEAKRYNGVASKANKHMFNKLSAYDRAVIVYKNTEDVAAAIREFTFADTRAAMAFCYNEIGASYVNVNNEDGDTVINIYEDTYNESGAWDGLVLSKSFCLG